MKEQADQIEKERVDLERKHHALLALRLFCITAELSNFCERSRESQQKGKKPASFQKLDSRLFGSAVFYVKS